MSPVTDPVQAGLFVTVLSQSASLPMAAVPVVHDVKPGNLGILELFIKNSALWRLNKHGALDRRTE